MIREFKKDGNLVHHRASDDEAAAEDKIFVDHGSEWHLVAYRHVPGRNPACPSSIEFLPSKKPIKFDPETGKITEPATPKPGKSGKVPALEKMDANQLEDFAVRNGFTDFHAKAAGKTPEQQVAIVTEFLNAKAT